MEKQNFQHHYFSLQCHMILQKSFWYADVVLKKHFLLLSMLKTFVLQLFSSLALFSAAKSFSAMIKEIIFYPSCESEFAICV